jgi:hypothetical protein
MITQTRPAVKKSTDTSWSPSVSIDRDIQQGYARREKIEIDTVAFTKETKA